NGSIYMGASAFGLSLSTRGQSMAEHSLLLAPSSNGSLTMLAGDSIYAGGYAVNQSGASLAVLPTPFRPAFVGADVSSSSSIMVIVNNLDSEGIKLQPGPDSTQVMFPLFAFGPNSSAGATWGSAEPARFYAGTGDIVGLRTGEMMA